MLKPAIRTLLRRAPFYGFKLGSNCWPLVEMAEDVGGEKVGVEGEDIMEAIRLGYLRDEQLVEPVATLRHPTEEGLEADIDHRYHVTRAGLEALVAAHEAEEAAKCPTTTET